MNALMSNQMGQMNQLSNLSQVNPSQGSWLANNKNTILIGLAVVVAALGIVWTVQAHKNKKRKRTA